MKGKAILLYARVPNASMLDQGFYADEADGLRAHDDVESVTASQQFKDVFFGRYDALLGYFFSFASLAALIALLRGKRTILTGGAEQLRREFAPNIISYMGRIMLFYLGLLMAKKILAVSTSDYERMRQLAFIGKGKIKLSYHGVPAVTEKLPKELSSNGNRPSASFVTICGLDSANNIRRKGMFEALEFIASVAQIYPETLFTIIGRDDKRNIIDAETARLGIAERVTITGYVSATEKYELLQNHKYYVQLSHYEGFGIGALEALAQGAIVIHSNVGGLRDTVGDYGMIYDEHVIEHLDKAQVPSGIDDHLAQFAPRVRAQIIMDSI